MKRSIIVAALGVAALSAALAWWSHDDALPTLPTVPDAVEMPRPQRTRADTSVERPAAALPATLRGTVVGGAQELPDAGRVVELLRDGRVVARATSDGIGRFVFRAVTPGAAHDVRVTADDCLTVLVPSLTLQPGEHRDVGTLVLAPPRIVPVTVTDERGKPVPGTVVDVFREARGETGDSERRRVNPLPAPVATVTVDERGEGELALCIGNAHTVVARAPGHARADAPFVEWLLLDGDGRLRIVLPPAQTLRGTVLDPAGDPVPGALVLARRRPRVRGYHGERADSAALWVSTHADNAGSFELTGLPPGTIDLCAGRDNALPGEVTSVDVPAIEHVRLVLCATASIGGRMRAHETDAPIAGVVVAYRVGIVAATTVTGANGEYRVDGLPAGELVHVDFSAPPGWSNPVERGAQRLVAGLVGGAFQEWLHAGEHLDIDLTYRRAAAVQGTVTMNGEPAAAAWVCVYTLPDPPLRGGYRTTRSDAGGHYRIDDAVPGRAYALALPSIVSSDDESSAFNALSKERFDSEGSREAAAVAIPASVVTQLDVAAALPGDFKPWRESVAGMDEIDTAGGMRRISVIGRVTTADGLPLRELRVGSGEGDVDDPVDVDEDFAPWRLLPVSADGRFKGTVDAYPNLPGALDDRDSVVSFTFHVSAVDARHGAVAQNVTVRPENTDEPITVDLVLPPLPRLRGTVVCDGEPVSGADVYSDHSVVTRTAADGTFEIWLATGLHFLEARATGYVNSDSYDVWPPEQQEVEIELVAARELSGTVTDAAGRPVRGMLVRPFDKDRDRFPGFGDDWEGGNVPLTDAEGRFHFPRLPRAPVYLQLEANGSGPLVTARFLAGPFVPEDNDVRIVTREPRRLTGRIVFPEGAEVSRVRIYCTPLEDALAAGGGDRELQTSSGTFTFDDLLSASYELSVVPPPSSRLQPAEVTIAPDQDEVEVELEGAAVISGVIRWKNGSPFTPDLQLRPVDDLPVGASSQDLRIDVEDDGTFAAYVRSGTRYAIDLRRGDWSNAIRIEGGETVLAGTTGVVITATRMVGDVDPEALRAGEIGGSIVTTGGDGIEGADVLLVPNEGAVLRASTDAEGRFSVTGLSSDARTASVAVFADGRCSVQVDDVKVGKTRLRISMSLARTISGRLLTADDAPATGYRIRAWRSANPIHDLWRADLDADGRFVLTGVARGTWTLEAIIERSDGIHEVVPLGNVKGGAKNLELRLP